MKKNKFYVYIKNDLSIIKTKKSLWWIYLPEGRYKWSIESNIEWYFYIFEEWYYFIWDRKDFIEEKDQDDWIKKYLSSDKKKSAINRIIDDIIILDNERIKDDCILTLNHFNAIKHTQINNFNINQ